MEPNKNKSSRRKFIKQATLLSAVAASMPNIILAENKVTGQRLLRPAERVNLACIGIGNRGGEIIMEFHKTGLANIVALCDVDMGAPHTQKVMTQFPQAKRFQDFRQMFDKIGSEIDAVCIGTPDFSHFPITMTAMALGKHVYVEKPMGRTFNEVGLMMKAAEKHNRVVTQMGNQGHSEANYF